LDLVNEWDPGEIVDVPSLARDDEADWHALRLGASIARVPVTPAFEPQTVPSHEGAALLVLAHEPLRKLENLNAGELRRLAIVSDGRRTKWLVLTQFSIELPEPLDNRVAKARFGNVRNREVAIVAPEVQTTNEDGINQEIDHCSRPERRHDLTLPDGAFGLLLHAIVVRHC
jgi:hypothetical protein